MTCNCDRDGNIEYTITLNAQGPQGLNGPAGQDGFSPRIDIYENTEQSYRLNITTVDGTIVTPNLKANITTLDDYVTIGTNQTISGIKTYMSPQYFYDGLYIYNNTGSTYARVFNNNNGINISPSSGTTVNINGKLFATNGTSDSNLSPVVLSKNISGDDYINVTNTNGIIDLSFNSSKIDLSNYITLDSNQTITGLKNFTNGITAGSSAFNGPIFIGRAGIQNNIVPTLGTFIAGEGIDLSISNDGKITINNTASGGNNLISKLTATEYSNLASKDSNTLYIVIADDNSNFTMYYGEIPMYMPSGGGGDNASQRTYLNNISTNITATKVE